MVNVWLKRLKEQNLHRFVTKEWNKSYQRNSEEIDIQVRKREVKIFRNELASRAIEKSQRNIWVKTGPL